MTSIDSRLNIIQQRINGNAEKFNELNCRLKSAQEKVEKLSKKSFLQRQSFARVVLCPGIRFGGHYNFDNHVLMLSLGFLSVKELKNCMLTCKRWHFIASNPKLQERIWTIFIRENDPSLYSKFIFEDKKTMIVHKKTSMIREMCSSKINKSEVQLEYLSRVVELETTLMAVITCPASLFFF